VTRAGSSSAVVGEVDQGSCQLGCGGAGELATRGGQIDALAVKDMGSDACTAQWTRLCHSA
jgi:hypothetical protein